MARFSRLVQALCLALSAAAWSAPFELVKQGRSDVVIYHAPDAPKSVQMGAEELQRYVQEATGARLAVVQTAQSPMICLGDNVRHKQTVSRPPICRSKGSAF